MTMNAGVGMSIVECTNKARRLLIAASYPRINGFVDHVFPGKLAVCFKCPMPKRLTSPSDVHPMELFAGRDLGANWIAPK